MRQTFWGITSPQAYCSATWQAMKPKRGIEKKLTWWFLALSLIPLTLTGFLQLTQLRDSLWEATQSDIARNLAERELGLENLFAGYEHRAALILSNPELIRALEDIQGESRIGSSRSVKNLTIAPTLKQKIQAFLSWSGFLSLEVLDSQGQPFLQEGKKGMTGIVVDASVEQNKHVPRFSYWKNATGRPYLKLSLSIMAQSESQEPIGSAILTAPIDETEQVLSASTWPIFLFNQDQETILQLPDIFEIHPIPSSIITQALLGKTGIAYIEKQLVVYRYFPGTRGALSLLIDREVIFAPITRLTGSFALGGLLTIGAVILFAARAAKNIVKPIKTLSEGVEALSAGDLNASVEVVSGDEIETLSHRFNDMVGQIKIRDEALRASKETASRLFETGDEVRFFIDENWRILQVNKDALQDCFDYIPEEIIGRTIEFLFCAGQIPYEKDPMRHFQTKMRRKSGTVFSADLYWTDVLDARGHKTGALVAVRDISEKEERKRALKKSFKELTDLKYSLDQAAVVAITDIQGTIQYVNDKFCEVSQYSKNELLGADHRLLSTGIQKTTFIKTLWETIALGQVWRGQFKNKAKDGSFFWFDTTIVPLLDDQNNPLQYLAIHNDITQQKHYEEEVFRLSQHDHLTQLPNRALFNDRLKQAIKLNRWGDRPFAVMFVDLDRFKSVNDQLGHAIGDQLLQIVAQRLTHCLRQSDTVARIGGDEFTVLLPSVAQSEDVELVAQKMVDVLKEAYTIESHHIHLSGSIGISLFPEEGRDSDTLLKNADLAMYHAKKYNKGHFTFYSTLIQEKKGAVTDLESALFFALDRKEFVLCYQAQSDLETGRITGFEALIRWNKPGQELISPDQFIPLAEQNGLIVPIGRWVLETACTQLKSWQDEGLEGLSISVNVSALQFKQAGFAQEVQDILKTTGIKKGSLTLELTESLLIKHNDALIRQLEKLKAFGVQLEIDDFGTGYSSLSYLKNFPIDGLKIDRAFVEHLPANREDAAISSMIITLADHLGLRVVAEGIETQEQLHYLKSQGCTTGQGYLISLPISGEDAGRLLRKDVNSAASKTTKTYKTVHLRSRGSNL